MWYSQHGEDRWLEANWSRLGLPEHGVFVDVGASEGLIESNTAWLERERGWTGICIDADPRCIAELRRNRKCTVVQALVGNSGWADFRMHPCQKWAGVLRTEGDAVRMRGVPLMEILTFEGLRTFDLLSIDVEGSELGVWCSFNVQYFRPRVVIIEFATAGLAVPDRSAEIIAAVEPCGYKLETRLGGNLVFLRQ